MSSLSLNGHGLSSGISDLGSDVVGLAPQHQNGETFQGGTAALISDAVPQPRMTEKAKRRRFTKAYKLRIVEEADECTERGELGALLRREGLYASTLANFRQQEADGLLEPSTTRKRVSKDPELLALRAQRAEVERENRQLRRKLAHAEKIIAIQKKVALLLGETLQDMNLEEQD